MARAAAAILTLVALFGNVGLVEAATLANSSVALSDPRPSQTANYTFTGGAAGGLVTSTALRCIKVTFSTNSTTVTTPTGFTAASATVSASSTLLNGSTGTWSNAATANSITYTNTTNATAPATTTGATFIINGVTNSSVADTQYWYKINTFSDSGCATPIDNATVQFINTNGSQVSLTVDQTLTFTVNAVAASATCAGGTSTQASTATTIPFGTVTAASNGLVCQDLTASTNAANGYTVYIRNTGAPANALGQTIASTAGSNGTPGTFETAGTEAYGYSTNDTTLGTGTAGRFATNKYAAETQANAELAYESVGVTSTTYRIAHQVGISTTTKPGTYATTVIYTCTPVY